MSEERQTAAIKSRIWLGGKFLFRDPVPVNLTEILFEGTMRVSNTGLRVDRNWIGAGYPNKRNRFEITLPWADLREPGLLQHLDILLAVGQPFGLGLWKQVYDVFDGDGTTKSFLLQRQQLLEYVTPPTEFPDYPTRVLLYDRPYWEPDAVATELTVTQKSTADINASDPSTGEAWVEDTGHMEGNLRVSTLKVGDAPPAADSLVAVYLPMIWVVVKQQQPRSYGQALVEQRGMTLVEFG